MSRPEFYDVCMLTTETEPTIRLCRCCFSVMANEGSVAGDPGLPAYKSSNMACAWPVYNAKVPCANCESLRRFEEKRALLGAPPKRIGEVVQ